MSVWPFKRDSGQDRFDPEAYGITSDERRSIGGVFDNFMDPDGRKIGLEMHPPEVTRGLFAHGLWLYAEQQAESADFLLRMSNRMEGLAVLDRAIKAIKKAEAIYHLPVYRYDLARYVRKRGDELGAIDMFRQFLDLQSRYRPHTYDHYFLRERDIDQAVRAAQAFIAGETEEPEPQPAEQTYMPPPGTRRWPGTW